MGKSLPYTPAEQRRVGELLAALRTKVEEYINPESDLLSREFVDEFRSRLLAQHVFIGSVFEQGPFDSAFLHALRASGEHAEFAPAGRRFWDIDHNHSHISLKSTKASDLKDNSLHISKLTEAAWIQDCRTAVKRQSRTIELFKDYFDQVQRIFQLRYFRKSSTYELVEIPLALLRPVLNASRLAFNADGPTIGIPIGEVPPHWVLKLDRSDAKITLTRIRKNLCIVHASWQIKMPEPMPNKQ